MSLGGPGKDRRVLAVVAILGDGSVHVLADQFVAPADGETGLLIGMTAKGTTISSLEGEQIPLRADAVTLTLCEKSERTYVYQRGTRRFREIWTYD